MGGGRLRLYDFKTNTALSNNNNIYKNLKYQPLIILTDKLTIEDNNNKKEKKPRSVTGMLRIDTHYYRVKINIFIQILLYAIYIASPVFHFNKCHFYEI